MSRGTFCFLDGTLTNLPPIGLMPQLCLHITLDFFVCYLMTLPNCLYNELPNAYFPIKFCGGGQLCVCPVPLLVWVPLPPISTFHVVNKYLQNEWFIPKAERGHETDFVYIVFRISRLSRSMDSCTLVASFHSLARLVPQIKGAQHPPAAERYTDKVTAMIFFDQEVV